MRRFGLSRREMPGYCHFTDCAPIIVTVAAIRCAADGGKDSGPIPIPHHRVQPGSLNIHPLVAEPALAKLACR
jgi:hypothetical protein